jgi:hypothetical protein
LRADGCTAGRWSGCTGRGAEVSAVRSVGKGSWAVEDGCWGITWEETVIAFEFGQEAVEFEDRESSLGCQVVFTCPGLEEGDTGLVQCAEDGWSRLQHEG